ncbi:MAG: ATP-grasp domain-containing protein, partial [Kofleriaceae bacterium]
MRAEIATRVRAVLSNGAPDDTVGQVPAQHLAPAVHVRDHELLGVLGQRDRSSERVVMIGSARGGMEIEELAETDPDAIKKVYIEP